MKSLFLPDTDDYELYELDIRNAEMRVLTSYSNDDNLTNAFNEGKDLHCLTAAGISDYTYEDIKAHKEDKTTDQYRKRQLAKKVNFGKWLAEVKRTQLLETHKMGNQQPEQVGTSANGSETDSTFRTDVAAAQ